MSGFEFTPLGILPLGAYRASGASEDIAGATADVPGPASADPAPRSAAAPRAAATSPALTPRTVMKLARQRLRELDREIKRIKSLEKERDQLRRLLAAADAKRPSPVRALPNNRTA